MEEETPLRPKLVGMRKYIGVCARGVFVGLYLCASGNVHRVNRELNIHTPDILLNVCIPNETESFAGWAHGQQLSNAAPEECTGI